VSVERKQLKGEDANFEELRDVLEGAVRHRMKTRWNNL